ncbi:MAG: AzlC family ABC transporter permease, partial [Burkholderiales bacterium]|nr:AzlC family ABC transporter permease [Burkholderiales bacterium]
MLDSWRRLTRDPDFHAGAREMAGIALGIGAWGLVTGVAMVKSGLGVPLSLLMTLTVFAGSAQLSTLPLIVAGAPLWVIWATAACVNLRFVIFSAGWRPYFAHLPLRRRLLMGYVSGDLNYVCFMRRYPEPVPAPGQLPYYWGGVAVNWSAWQGMSILGIVLADQVPTEWGLGFAGT